LLCSTTFVHLLLYYSNLQIVHAIKDDESKRILSDIELIKLIGPLCIHLLN